jgi:pimeloyl-ACP methyl ester carboxylesterase
MHTELHIHLSDLKLKLAALKTGNPKGPTIIALHGWLDNCMSFKPLLPYLQDFNLIAIDFAGHGLSAHRSSDSYLGFMDYINDLAFIWRELALDKAYLLGHSLGGSVAALFAGLFPEKVHKLCVIDSLGPMLLPIEQQVNMLRTASEQYLNLAHKKLKVFSSHEEAIQARLRASPMELTSLALLISRGLKDVPGGFSWRSDPRLMIPPMVTYSEEQMGMLLSKIACPSMLVLPNKGWEYGKDFFERRQAFVTNLQINTVTGHHHVHMDTPEIVAPLIKDFFKDN